MSRQQRKQEKRNSSSPKKESKTELTQTGRIYFKHYYILTGWSLFLHFEVAWRQEALVEKRRWWRWWLTLPTYLHSSTIITILEEGKKGEREKKNVFEYHGRHTSLTHLQLHLLFLSMSSSFWVVSDLSREVNAGEEASKHIFVVLQPIYLSSLSRTQLMMGRNMSTIFSAS